jgi:hypothetical protein
MIVFYIVAFKSIPTKLTALNVVPIFVFIVFIFSPSKVILSVGIRAYLLYSVRIPLDFCNVVF